MPQEKKNEKVDIHIAEFENKKEEIKMPTCENLQLKDNAAIRSLQNSSRSTSEFMFPQELNDCLRSQINNLTAENGALRRSLNEKEYEIQRLQEKLSNGYGFSGVGRASELAASKIVELSKRVRELTAELEGERSRRRKMTEVTKEKGNNREAKIVLRKDSAADKNDKIRYCDETEKRDEDVKTLKEKLLAASTRIAEWRNQCISLKQELKIADKILASEVGDSFTVLAAKATMGMPSPASAENAGWRGRAQQLTLLRRKLTEMEAKLKNQERWRGEGVEENEEWRKEREKWLQEIDRLRKSVAEAEKCAEEWRRKAEGSKARCASLKAETEALRARMSTVIAKGDHDDQLIASLNKCITKMESDSYEKELQMKRTASSWKREKEDLIQELMKEQTKVSRMKDTLSDKDLKLEKLEEELTGLNPMSDNRLSKQSTPQDKSTCYQSALTFQELQVICQTAEAERLRLMELATVLNQRLEEERTKVGNVLNELRMERRRNAKLEIKIGRMELESSSSRSKAYGWSSSRRLSNNAEKESIPEEVKYRIEILEEEKLVLESKIDSIKQEKECDLRKYFAMLEETRDFYMSKLGQLEQNKNTVRRIPST